MYFLRRTGEERIFELGVKWRGNSVDLGENDALEFSHLNQLGQVLFGLAGDKYYFSPRPFCEQRLDERKEGVDDGGRIDDNHVL